jgi:hypothetical protein
VVDSGTPVDPLSNAADYQLQAFDYLLATAEFGLDHPKFLTKVSTCVRPALDPIILSTPLS